MPNLAPPPTADPSGFTFLNESHTLNHPRLDQTIALANEAIFAPDDTGMVQIIGPTGAGKTHLTRCLRRQLSERFAVEMRDDPQFLPYVYIPVRLLSDRGFNWTAFYQDYLSAIRHPYPKFHHLNEARDKIVSACAARRTKVVIVDDAHHILAGCNDETVRAQSEVMKSICQDTGTKHLLVATYDLARWLRSNGQFARRTRVIHFRRYLNTPEDRAVFTRILRAIDQTCKEHLSVRLTDHDEMIYQGCVGLIGVLRNWLVWAFNNSLVEGEPRITLDALVATRHSTLDLTPILQEALAGERALLETDESKARFETLLNDGQAREASTKAVLLPKPKRRTNNRPGRRKPHRDPVGLPQ
jgi:type II secretory pathway predicted ATPase ExeA